MKPPAMLWEILYRKAHMARNWGTPLGNSGKRTEAFSAIAHEKPNPADNQVSELGRGFSAPVNPEMAVVPSDSLTVTQETLNHNHLVKSFPHYLPTETASDNECWLLSF